MSKANAEADPVQGSALRRDPVAGDHREGDAGLGAQPGHVQGALDATKPRDQAPRSRACSTSRSRPSTRSTSAARRSASAAMLGQRSDYKKAIVSLADGQTIDVTTGI